MKHLYKGLSSVEASKRLKEFGPNELASAGPKTSWNIALNTVKEPMFLLLLICGIVYLILGSWGEALFFISAILLIIVITFIQEQRAERTIYALKNLSSPRAFVTRDGIPIRIPGKEVVPGDLVLVSEGDRIPADGYVLSSRALKLDESILTGESVSVNKTEWDGKSVLGQAGGDNTAFLYSGTLVVQGSGTFQVHATGALSAIGRIGKSLVETKRPLSALQQETRRIVVIVAWISLFLSAGIGALWWFRDHHLLEGALMGITFAMATIPEEFPVVLTIFMALGAWRISKQKVLTRQVNAIETLGSATVLCVDKTGTLTENKMTLSAVWAGKSGIVKIGANNTRLSKECLEVIRQGALASEQHTTEPMDMACMSMATRLNLDSNELKLERSFPMVRPLLVAGNAWAQGYNQRVYVKGAPEAILKLCSNTPAAEIETAVQLMALQGYRVLAVAQTEQSTRKEETSLEQFKFNFVGLLGFTDPVRQGVLEAVVQCREAGIKIMLITGDYPVTALHVAREIGLENTTEVLMGSELASLSEDQLALRLKKVRVLARMVPEQKLRIVNALRKNGEVVAMTGDGVNDAPALKAADIGIAMGARGTDVAREAADLVLLNDDFESIVSAIRMGRQIYDNIQKAIAYIIAIKIPIIGLTLLPLLLGISPILWPVHLVFIELIVDPVCSIAFEAEPAEALIMKKPPRSIRSHLFGKATVLPGFLGGMLVLLAVLVVYLVKEERAVAFATLIFGNAGLILIFRSKIKPAWGFFRHPNPALIWIGLALLVMSAAVFYVPDLRQVFHFSFLGPEELAMSLLVAVLSLSGFEIVKAYRRKALQRVLG